MRIPGSPEEVTSLEGPCTLHFLTDFYAYARFKLTPERFVNYCDKCFLLLPGHEKVTLEGEIHAKLCFVNTVCCHVCGYCTNTVVFCDLVYVVNEYMH